MSRLLLLLLVALIAWRVWQALRRPRPVPPRLRREETVKCAHCGVFLPAREAVREGARTFCSEAHRRQAEDARA